MRHGVSWRMGERKASGGEQAFDVAFERLGLRGRREALDDLAVAPEQKLREIPLDRLGAQDARRRVRQPLVQGVRGGAVDIDLVEHLERDAVVLLAERPDLPGVTGLLV